MIYYLNDYLLKEDSFLKDRENNYLLTVDFGKDQEKGFLLDPYFKLYNSSKQEAATGIVRISLLDGRYIKHTNFPAFNINSKVKRNIISAFKGSVNIGKYKGMKVYDAIWKYLTDEAVRYNLDVATKTEYGWIP